MTKIPVVPSVQWTGFPVGPSVQWIGKTGPSRSHKVGTYARTRCGVLITAVFATHATGPVHTPCKRCFRG